MDIELNHLKILSYEHGTKREGRDARWPWCKINTTVELAENDNLAFNIGNLLTTQGLQKELSNLRKEILEEVTNKDNTLKRELKVNHSPCMFYII